MKLYPSWKGNLAVFGTLILLLLGNFFWQVQRINKSFRDHSLAQSKILGAVVELNIRNSLMSYAGMETLVGNHLKNSARFISYLNQVEPFTAQELAAFASESGLSGVKIISAEGKKQVAGPRGWLPQASCLSNNELSFLVDEHLYTYSYSEKIPLLEKECIIVGMSSKQAEIIQETMSVENLLSLLNQMEGIAYVRFKPNQKFSTSGIPSEGTTLIVNNGKFISETRIIIGDKAFFVGLEAGYFTKQMQQLRNELIVFIVFLVLFGCFSSWWLYRIQKHRLEQTREFERKMARQLEQASLGRAAATITHEMRNPLNAISIGLQRLEIEAESLDDDHRGLLTSMREAVERSNSVIINLQQYIRSFELDQEVICISRLIESLAVLYQPQCLKNNIELNLSLDESATVIGDNTYLTQAFENLIKNAVEAQPDGGFIRIEVLSKDRECMIEFRNPYEPLTPEARQMVLEPYFTTKTYGSGLGLAISKKIIEAHSGRLQTDFSNDQFCVSVWLSSNHDSDKTRCVHNENIDCR